MTTLAYPFHLYTDGGVIQKNPSTLGGTWAYTLLDSASRVIYEHSGVITPEMVEMPVVTNNLTELLAVVYGLELVIAEHPQALDGLTVYSDSRITLLRVFEAGRLNGVPAWLKRRLQTLQSTGQLARVRYVQLDGHPTKAQLEAGIGKRGNPVSVHNVRCDRLCNEGAKAFFEWMGMAQPQMEAAS